ncbi:MAG: DUF2970 domain-containing protein [Gammaproteobacteria bacterium]|nr:DUF2970 domain-containing protein [Gammaproteobacteria bacterium]
MNQAVKQDIDVSPDTEQDLTLLQVMGSVFAAGFGVQSKQNKVRDFTRGKPLHFVIAGLAFTVALLVGLITVVHLIV